MNYNLLTKGARSLRVIFDTLQRLTGITPNTWQYFLRKCKQNVAAPVYLVYLSMINNNITGFEKHT